jgi:hypothetical protein
MELNKRPGPNRGLEEPLKKEMVLTLNSRNEILYVPCYNVLDLRFFDLAHFRAEVRLSRIWVAGRETDCIIGRIMTRLPSPHSYIVTSTRLGFVPPHSCKSGLCATPTSGTNPSILSHIWGMSRLTYAHLFKQSPVWKSPGARMGKIRSANHNQLHWLSLETASAGFLFVLLFDPEVEAICSSETSPSSKSKSKSHSDWRSVSQ